MKHLLTLTLSLAAAANPLAALADQCDNLRNNQQAYRDCVNDWYGRSNRGSAPSPWWKNYDPNEGSSGNSGSLIQPREEWQRQQREESQRREQERQQQSRQQSLRTQGLNESVEYFVQGQQHYAAGRVEAAADNFRKALALARYHKHDPQSQATIALGLGRAALDLRRYDEAQALFFEVLGVPTRRYESENDEAVYTLLGRTLMGAKRYDAAEVLYKKLAEIIERKVILDAKTAGPGFDAWAGAMDNLATAIEQLGRHAEAEPYRKRVYDATLKTVTSQHQSALNKLNANLEAQGKPSMGQRGAAEYDAIYAMNEQLLLKRYTQALIASDNAMQLAERHSNPGLYALAQEKKAEALIKLNRHAEAESILKKSLESREQHVELKPKLVDYGSREIGLRGNLSGLANLYVAQKQYAQAEPYLQRIVELQEKTRAPVIETVRSLNSLALNLRDQKRYDEAETLYKRGLGLAETSKDKEVGELAISTRSYLADLQRQRSGGSAPSTQPGDWKTAWRALSDEAVKLSADGKLSPAVAVEKAREALALAEKNDDPTKYVVASSQQLLAQLLWRDNQTNEAEALLKAAINTIEKSNESEIALALSKTLTVLARLQTSQKRSVEAEVIYKRVIELQEKQADPNVPALIETLTRLENLYSFELRNQRNAEYDALLRRKLALQEKQYGPEHVDVAATLYSLASHLSLQGLKTKGTQSTAYYPISGS